MNNILISVVISSILCMTFCCCFEKNDRIEHRPFPMTLIYQKTIIDSADDFPVMKKANLNRVRIKNTKDFINLFDHPEELYNVKVEDFTPENPQLHGKIFTAIQKIKKIDVYASYVKVQTFSNGLIRNVEYSFSDEGRTLDCKVKPFSEDLKKLIADKKGNCKFSEPVTLIYDPVLVNDQGNPFLVWLVDVNAGEHDAMRYFISQKDNQIVSKTSLSSRDLQKKEK